MKNNNITFEYVEDFADCIVERVENDDELFLTVVGKFKEIKDIIKEIITISDVDFESICIESPDSNGYIDEYVLDCWCGDGVVQIGCEPAKRDGRYLNLTGDETYIFDNCNHKLTSFCEGSKLYFVNIEDECNCDKECDTDCPCDCHNTPTRTLEFAKDEAGNIHGFSYSKSDNNSYTECSYYSSTNISDKQLKEMFAEFWD